MTVLIYVYSFYAYKLMQTGIFCWSDVADVASPKPLLLTQIHICYSPAGRSVSWPLAHFFPIQTDLSWWIKFLFLPLNLTKSFPKELEWFRAVTTSRSFINWTIFGRLRTFSPKGNFRHGLSRPRSNSPQVVSPCKSFSHLVKFAVGSSRLKGSFASSHHAPGQIHLGSSRLPKNMQKKEWKHTTWIKYNFTLLLFFMSTP